MGETLDSAFRIFRATLIKCLPYGALAVVASQLPAIYELAVGHSGRRFGGGDPMWWVLFALGPVLILALLWNATVLRQHAIATGRPTTAAAELREGLFRAPVFAWLVIVVGLLVALIFLPSVALRAPYRVWGVIVLAVPATYVTVMLSCSWTALLLAGKGPLGSFSYSVRLVSGNWWRVVTLYSVGFAMLIVFYVIAIMLAAVVVPLAGGGDIAVVSSVSAVVFVALGSVGIPFGSALALAIFGDLQVRKEGTDLERRIAGAASE